MIPWGSAIIGSVFVGNSLGEGNPKKAKIYLKLIFFYTFIVLFSGAVLLIIFKHYVVEFFTNEEEIIPLISD
jgi:Na+-driven multidrug efflux pump